VRRLAHHYSKAEDLEKAYEYFRLSGEKAYRNSSMSESIRHFQELWLSSSTCRTRNRTRCGWWTLVSWPGRPCWLWVSGGSLDILTEGERLAEELGDRKRLTQLCGFIAHYLSYKGDSPRGYQYARKGPD